MNVERWVAKRKTSWQELETLLLQVDKKGLHSLDKKQLHALGPLYRSASADLSRARAMNLGADIVGYLNNLVVKAHNQVYQRPSDRWLEIVNYFWEGFPRLVRENIGYIGASFAIFVLATLACWAFELRDVNFAHLELAPGKPMISEDMWQMIERKRMWTDAAQDASPAFASMISTNNIKVCIAAFALGLTAGVGTFAILFFNGMFFGTVLGACQNFGMLSKILTFVVGHGSLELPAIFISGGAGLLLGSGILFPGRLKRMDSFKQKAKTALGIFGGCVPMLLIAGAIEGFISPRTDLPVESKLAVGIVAFACLLIYLFIPRDPLVAKRK